ncbi:MAG TPA: hypothetical protein VF310_03765, partial [Vicinamibacteria bacterium]
YPERPGLAIRVEAGAYRGEPAFFRVVGPWSREREQPPPRTFGERAGAVVGLGLALGVIGVALLLARRHLREGRGDRVGGTRLAAYTFVMGMAAWAFCADHVGSLEEEMGLLLRGLGVALVLTALIWTLYLALEPYVRRRSPHALISWARLLAGRVRDPLVGRDVLIGIAAGALFALLGHLARFIPEWMGSPGFPPLAQGLETLVSQRLMVAHLLFNQLNAAGTSLALLLVILVSRQLLRWPWLGTAAVLALMSLPDALALGARLWISLPVDMLLLSLPVAILIRFGLLSAIVTFYVGHRLILTPLTDDMAAWSAGPTQVLLLLLAVLATYGFRQSLGGRPLFKGWLAGA